MALSWRLREFSACVMLALAAWFASITPGDAQAATQSYRTLVRPAGQPPLSIHAVEMGRGPVVLLLHGLGGSSYTWRHIAPALARRRRVIAIDLRGFGRSDKPFDQAYSPVHHAAVVRAFIKARGLNRVTLVGHSLGGLVAMILAQDRALGTSRIERLVLIDAPVYPQPISAAVKFLRAPLLPYVALLVVPPELPTLLAFMTEKVGFDRLSNRDISIYASPLRSQGGPHALIATARNIVPPDFRRIMAGYRRIRKPALVIWCRDDQVVPLASGKRLAATLPNARLVVLDGCDHVPPEQRPRAVLRHMKRFFGR